MRGTCAVLLAAGDGKRMKSEKPKVLCEVLFRPMARWAADALKAAGVADLCAVCGAGAELVQATLPECEAVMQAQRLGTGHAVMQARAFLERHRGCDCAVLCGDAPFLDADTLSGALALHRSSHAAVTLITACLEDPTGYGRILRDGAGQVMGIVEQADTDAETAAIREVNSGAYWFRTDFLLEALSHLAPANAQGEYYLTDTVAWAVSQGFPAAGFPAASPDVVLGANDRAGLLRLNELARRRVLEKHLQNGVEIVVSDGVVVADDAVIGADTVLLPGTIIKPGCTVGRGCVIGPNTVLEQSSLGDGCVINASQIEFSSLGCRVKLGPFSHVRPGSCLKDGAKVGNFVEIKNSTVGEKTAVAHLTYVGDSDVGSRVNFGCGTVTVNYDGFHKYRTVIGDDVFIGCNANLIAPVKIGDGCLIAAGSTITDDVPADALAIARARQLNRPDWARQRRLRLSQKD
ncbi:MAG: bifunctional UDP-N-acetylglucosamine diphosphorylase/glucosamine-1-phosphate N-acetyltransferase GlmU [Oscillospiraceae bacterium]|nr:bifunctional UDP-N-acetylglucosamine diphosphorylase/glucosamine-1-phosphate N-acetyltransferase GlmU [Oscillospiraceae bacterium]